MRDKLVVLVQEKL